MTSQPMFSEKQESRFIEDFSQRCLAVGDALWRGKALRDLMQQQGQVNLEQAQTIIEQGTRRQHQLKHYAGAMFYYGGEWYWGIDRLHHLEHRLRELKANTAPGTRLIAPCPDSNADDGFVSSNPPAAINSLDAKKVSAKDKLYLEMYFSARSPYSSICFDHCVALCDELNVQLILRPVLPMVMRGATMTREKGLYFFFDAAREAKQRGLRWGNIADPIGEPVNHLYSLFSWAREQGKATRLFSEFFRAAFVNAIDTNTDQGLQAVVENAGLSWQQAQSFIGNTDWQEEIEANRLAMYDFQCWGVPSFRLLDSENQTLLTTWGQDRLWLVAKEIKRATVRR